MLITNQIAENLGLTVEELTEAARRNTVAKFGIEFVSAQKMAFSSLLKQPWTPEPFETMRMSGPGLFTLTNNIHINGAALMLVPDVLERIGEKAGMDYYVLPSSIHEVLIAKDDGRITKKMAKELITTAIGQKASSSRRMSYRTTYIFTLAKPKLSKSFEQKSLAAAVRDFVAYDKNFYMVISLIQPERRGNSQGQTDQKSGAEGAATKTKAELVQIGLQVIFWQTMIGTQNECFGVADHDVQPVQQTRVGIEGVVLMGVAFQRWNVTAV